MQARKNGNAQGIDVSHWQGTIDWKKVAGSGITFAFIKATQNGVDSKFLENVKGAKAAGILVGAYHFLDNSVVTEGAAKAAAKVFYKALLSADGVEVFDLPPVLDYESKASGVSTATATAIAKAFLEEIKSLTGVTPILYTYPAFISNFSGLSNYPLWIARYSIQAPADASGWKRWDFWQYSDGSAGGTLPGGGRSVNGISGHVDLNEYSGSAEDLKKRFSKTKEDDKVAERDINKVSGWAEATWNEAVANGYFDGTRPGAAITREEVAAVVNRLRGNFLKLVAGATADIQELEKRMAAIEKGEK
ncbi:hypothetical protein A8L34_22580 [Bacillus sp. FJAT-27264]|uniref:glycoside hydrolase family 25 protein n=1 Tax=Paenibacillus sp. (strain DSM 101736 / FJAT-27264) TaxID=1850362 RepID=UPI000807F926|nr:glycoside hydrolase family 25 protein [Bacillus sp. FJAT-27264]OBZ08938.1 hypothetical protein A8L34_22580 [Bacillus sp. FJAT-27264]